MFLRMIVTGIVVILFAGLIVMLGVHEKQERIA